MSVAVEPLPDQVRRLLGSVPAAMSEPSEVWGLVREQGRLFRQDGVVLVARHEDVRALAKDRRLSNRYHVEGSRAEAIMARMGDRERAAHVELSDFESLYVSRADGEAHDRLRNVMHRAFTPRRMTELSHSIDRYVDELLTSAAGEEVVDFRALLAARLPLMLIADLLGVPQSDGHLIHAWADALAANRGGEDPVALLAAHAAMGEFRHYVEDVVMPMRGQPGGSDLVRALLDAEQGEALTPVEVTAQFLVLLFAGFETTTNLLGLGMLELWRHEDEWRRLCDDPSLAGSATEELLRWVSPLQWIGRVATADITVGDETILRGETVYAVLAAANRDPAVFADPERLDIARPEAKRHLAFGLGPHFCLGNVLTRLEGRATFEALARRFPDARLEGDEPEWCGNAMLRTVRSIPVRLGRDRRA